MQTIKRGKDFTGILMGKCRNGHTSRFDTGKFVFNGWIGPETRAEGGRPSTPEDMKRPCLTEGCDRTLNLRNCTPLYGRMVEEKVCDGRCMGATGPSCDCSCGGMNHGAGHGTEVIS